MNIHLDKIEAGPPHALSRGDIQLIFETVPRDWTEGIQEVRIANSLERGAHTFFARYDGCLTIYSRNRTTKQALAGVLSELAAISLRLDRGLHYRPKSVRERLAKMAAPYLQQLLPIVAQPGYPMGYVSLEGFKELRFPFVPNDVES